VSYRTDSYDPDYVESQPGGSFSAAANVESEGNQLLILGLCLFVVPTLGWLISAAFAVGDEASLVTEMVVAGYALGAVIFLIIIGSPRIAGTDRA